MAVDFISGNSTRSFRDTSPSGLDFPDADWAVIFWARIDDSTGNFFRYIFSTGLGGVADKVNVFFREGGASNPRKLVLGVASNTITGTTNIDGIGSFLSVAQRTGETLQLFTSQLGGSAVLEGSLTLDATGSQILTTTEINFAQRSDGNTDRFYEDHLGEAYIIHESLTVAEIEAVANGVPLYSIKPNNLKGYWLFRENVATMFDLIQSNDLTRSGTGLLTSEHFPLVSGVVSVVTAAAVSGRIMSSLVAAGGLAGSGGIAGQGGGLAA